MNPKINDKMEMNWKDYTTTAAQWIAILGGALWAVLGSLGMAPGGPYPGVSLALTGLAGGKKGSILEDMVNIVAKGITGSKTCLLIITSLCLLIVSACGQNHPLLRPDSRIAAMQVAAPYVMADCSAIELYAGYRFDWATVDPNGDPDFKHGFGGIIGGCGKYAKISCNVINDCSQAVGDCKRRVVCEVIKVLK